MKKSLVVVSVFFLALLAIGAVAAPGVLLAQSIDPTAALAAPAVALAAATTTSTAPQTGLHQTGVRRPLGVYAHVDLTGFIKDQKKTNRSIKPADLETQFNSLYQSLLANPVISGLAVGVHWGLVNPNPPSAANAYDWSYLDTAFSQISMWNAKNPTQTPKTIQLIVTAGFNAPQWLLEELPSCDGLFHSPAQTPPSNCGKVTFMGYAEPAEGSGVLPLPWNPTYKSAFKTFLIALAARYESNPVFVSIDVSGPTAASTEMFLPDDSNSTNPQTQFGADISPDDMWLKLLALHYPNQPSYQNSDQAFIDEWNAAIDLYGQIFKGVTLVTIPAAGGDTGGGFPVFSQNFPPPPATDKLFSEGDCSAPDMSCAAVTIILSHFIDPAVGGANGKATQTSGMKAYNPKANLGIGGVKLLSGQTASLSVSAQILGGEQYDHPFSTDASFEGCLTKQCTNVSPEQAEYNVLKAFFDGTPAAASFGGTPGTAPLNYLQDSFEDIQYATAHVNAPAQVVHADGTSSMMTAQDLLNLASQKLLQISDPAD